MNLFKSKVKLSIIFLPGIFMINFYAAAQNKTTNTKDKYTADWASFSKYKPIPTWLSDAKFGIYFNYGVYTVPEKFSEWYPRSMYDTTNAAFEYHKKTYGDQKVFGYHDFVPMFTASKFDAAEWARVVKASGARYAGLVAEHHDGFSMWKSKLTPWNAYDMGPKRDITGELAKEIRKNGMKFITTFHHERNLQRNAMENNGGGYDSHFIYNKAWHTSSNDPKLRLLYGNMPEAEFDEFWLNKIKEVIDQYSPDMIYFDSWLNLIPEKYLQKFCAYYLNYAAKHHIEPVIISKQYDLPATVSINDIEKGGHMEIFRPTWMSDDTMNFGSWSYTDESKIKPTAMVLGSLIDIVSKNGTLLLAVSPRADGSIPPEQVKLMREMGDWLKINGESIFNTRPWLVHGAGPTMPTANPHGGMETTSRFTADDYRFTQSKDGKSVYLTFLGKPKVGNRIRIREIAPHRYPLAGKIKKVIELQSGVEAKVEETDSSLFLTVPNVEMNNLAVVFKIILE